MRKLLVNDLPNMGIRDEMDKIIVIHHNQHRFRRKRMIRRWN